MFNIPIFSIFIFLINLLFISSNFDFYKHHFSLFFNRAYNRFYYEQNLGDESISHLLYNQIITEVKIGQCTDKIFLFLTFNNSDINVISPSYLNSISYDKDMIKNNTILKNDKIKFPKFNSLLDINFFLNIKENDLNTVDKSQNNSYLGLGLDSNNQNSLINQLKNNNIILNRRFSVLFKERSITDDSKYDGQILFGLLPHDMTIRYNEKDLYWTSIINENNSEDLKWKIKFDSINYNEDKDSLKIKEAEFDISLNLIIAPEEYREKIVNNYLNKFINQKLCNEEIFYNKRDNQFYLSYSCVHNLDLEKFPTLSFYNRQLNETFIMNYENLLCVFKAKLYLKIVFKKNGDNNKWILGRAFMEVFPLIFDVDNKKIGYYKMKLSENHPIYLFIFFILIISIFIWGSIRGIQYEKRKNMELIRKKKDDDFKEENIINNGKNKKYQTEKNEKTKLKNVDEGKIK